jgi:hypothetical protein
MTPLSCRTCDMLNFMADTDRRPLTLAVATWEYLDQLSKLGTHGTSVPDVAKTLIEEGVRRAIKDGFLKQRPAFATRPDSSDDC